MRIRLSALGAVICLVTLALSACANGANVSLPANGEGGFGASTTRRTSAGPLAIGRAYFADAAVVREYPITHGIAASAPDNVLHLPSLASADVRQLMDIAVDPNGNLAVLTATYKKGRSAEYTNKLLFYAPGSRGNDPPSSVLNLPGQNATTFTIQFDPNANAYVGMDYGSGQWGYNVYASGSAGSAAPQATFPLSTGATPTAFLGDTMYVSGEYSRITAYANAATRPVARNTWCLPGESWGMGSDFGIDTKSNRLFVPEWQIVSHKDTSRIAIYPLNKDACPRYPISEHVSPTPNGFFSPTAVWYNDNYIYVGDSANNVTYEVPAKVGVQAPVVTLHGLGAMAFGP